MPAVLCKQHHISYMALLYWRQAFIKSGDISPDVCNTCPRHDKAYWKDRILEANSSGLSMAEWCRQHHISYGAMLYWRQRFIKSGELPGDICNLQQRHDGEYWKRQILEADNSGLSMAEWCRRHQLSYEGFKNWRLFFIRKGEFSPDVCQVQRKIEKYWEGAILEADTSGLTMMEWCRRHQITYGTFKWWRQELIKRGVISSAICSVHPHHNKEYWKKLILEADASKLTMLDWCRQHQIVYVTFRARRRALIKSGEITSDVCNTQNRRTAGQWKEFISKAAASELTIKDWCQKHQIVYDTFQYWGKRLMKNGELCFETWEKLVSKTVDSEPVFCELTTPTEEALVVENRYISRGSKFRIGKFCLSVEEDVPEELLNIALEMLNTVAEVFGNAEGCF